MFPSFIGILDIQSWWEVPSIAYFCSLFRTAFNLLDFDIEELEEALLTDGTEESASSLLTELIVRLLNGCLGNNDISAFNYQMYLRRLFRRKCQETGRYNPFNTDIDFQFLPLRTKVEILYALCDFRLDADDVLDLFKNLEAESLRVEPLGWDVNHSAYWYFYGTRLYREDIIRKGKNKKKKGKESKKRGWFYGDDWLDDEETERVWQVVCFTEEDWSHLTEKFSKATSKVEKELYRSLSQNFLPEIPRLFQEKERLQRKRLLELAPRRTSSRVLQKIKQKEEESKPSDGDSKDSKDSDRGRTDLARETRAKRRDFLRTKSESSDSSEEEEPEEEEEGSSSDKEMPQKASKRPKGPDKKSKKSSATNKGEPPPEAPVKTGRKTNNSLACAVGQILIPDAEEPVNSTRKKLKTSQIFSQTEEDIQTDMYKVLEQLTAHEDAWPFMDPVEEEYAPNYYAVIRRPMDLRKMEERLDTGFYTDFSMFKADFKLIVNNCRLYNGQDNEYTMMVDNLQAAFDRLTEKYMHRLSSSDEEIAVEYQIPTPSRKHKLKPSESPTNHKKKKRKSQSETGEEKSSPERTKEDRNAESTSKEVKESHHKSKDGKAKKQRKGHHRHGKHSKNHKKEHHKSDHGSKNTKHSKKQRREKDKDGKKSKQKRKKNKHTHEVEDEDQRVASPESAESSHCCRSASPLPSIHTPSPSPTPPPSPDPDPDPDFFKDKYDKIKERRRGAAPRAPHTPHTPHTPHAWDALFDCKQKTQDKHKQNLPFPEKDKNRKLRETIEKLKAKNEKYKDSSPFSNLFTDKSTDCSTSKESSKEDRDDPDFTDDDIPETKEKHSRGNKKTNKKITTARNESASEALEQAVKDISKWLEDTPKGSGDSSPCDSPAPTVSTEEHDSRLDDELAGDRPLLPRRDTARKRPASREPRALKRREIQRTIDRLQPGKSKGNLLTNIASKNVEKVEEVVPSGPLNKVRDSSKPEESSPKLSLGSVLPPVEFTLGKDHNFADDEPTTDDKKVASDAAPEADVEKTEVPAEVKTNDETVETKKEVAKAEVEEPTPKLSQEKATPNLSAWFKAFGAPKSTPTTAAPVKKKQDEVEPEKKANLEKEATKEEKPSSPKSAAKYDSPPSPATPNPEGEGEQTAAGTPRPRRTSTASSVSERSSFSQDLDSPRHQLAHNSPLLRSPASPRTDDFQKITYPIINGTVRAGFYQDTTSMKSSPEKSCSPREGPQSPYSPYSQHVYASNNSLSGSATPNYLPTYGQNQPPPYYDGARAQPAKPRTMHQDYTALGPDTYPHPDNKNTLFPVKKRTYNEADTLLPPKMLSETKDSASLSQNKSDYQKMVASMQSMSGVPSVDDIAAALGDKSELAKMSGLRDKPPDYLERRLDTRDHLPPAYNPDNAEPGHVNKKDSLLDPNKPIGMTKNDNVDMVNMGYMNPEMERRLNAEANDYSAAQRDMAKLNAQPKGFEIDAIAMNLGLSCGAGKGQPKPAHSQERSAADLALNHHLMQQEYEALGAAQGSFSLTDIELASKKLYSGTGTPHAAAAAAAAAAVDYGSWKSNPRKHEHSAPYAATPDKPRAAPQAHQDVNVTNSAALNYNKNLQQHQQYNAYNVQRSNIQNLPSELRIPNPRGLLKNEHMSVASSLSSSEMIPKSIDTIAKSQKPEKHQPPVSHSASSLQYKAPYSSHSGLPLDSLRNLPNIPQMLERYSNDERYLSSFTGGASLYHDKSFQMAHMSQFLNMASEHPASTAASAYSQPSVTMSKDTNLYKNSPNVHNTPAEPKAKSKRKRTTAVSQSYHPAASGDVLSSVKSSMVPGSAFNFGAAPNMPLYPDNSGFSIEDFRNSTNQLMAANYMAAVAHGRGSATGAGAGAGAGADSDKHAKPAHQASGGGAFGFMGAGSRAAPQYFPGDGSPLYQQYLQRHQEELLRQTGAQIMGLYPPGYPAALAARPPYDGRPSWL